MSDQVTLTVEKRDAFGKGENRRLREQGLIPGVFYNSKGENVSVQVAELPFEKAKLLVGSNKVFNLEIKTGDATETKLSLLWKFTKHPTKNKYTHVDFYGVDLDKKLRALVRVEVKGEAPGVKIGGGLLDVFRDHIEVVCLPLDIPGKIVIDVSGLQLNQSVHVKDLVMPEGVKAVYDDNYAVVGVFIPGEDEKKTEGEEKA